MMYEVASIYVCLAFVGSFFGAMMMSIEGHDWAPSLGTEGRVVLGIFGGLLWPIVALLALVWVLRAAWRGVMQCVRLVVPAKVEVPTAKVRR